MNHVHRMKRQKSRERRMVLAPAAFLWLGAGFVMVGILLWLGLRVTPEENEVSLNAAAAVGSPAPDFELKNLVGNDVTLADYRGNVVVVNFWATWCPPCRAEMPGIQAVYDTYKDQGMIVLAVNAQEDQDTIQSFVMETGFTFPILPDPYGQAIRAYGVRSFPATFVIDREGRIDTIHQGQITPDELETMVRPLL